MNQGWWFRISCYWVLLLKPTWKQIWKDCLVMKVGVTNVQHGSMIARIFYEISICDCQCQPYPQISKFFKQISPWNWQVKIFSLRIFFSSKSQVPSIQPGAQDYSLFQTTRQTSVLCSNAFEQTLINSTKPLSALLSISENSQPLAWVQQVPKLKESVLWTIDSSSFWKSEAINWLNRLSVCHWEDLKTLECLKLVMAETIIT